MPELTFDDFEVYVRREIENFISGENKKTTFITLDDMSVMSLRWRNTPDTASVLFSICIEFDINSIDMTLEVVYDDGDDEDNHFSRCVLDLPTSEEDYFQMSTVGDMGFRWEMYEHFISTFKTIRSNQRQNEK